MSNMIGRKVYRTEIVAEVPNRPSGLGFMPDGSFLIVSLASATDRSLAKVANNMN